jgi:uncharacterized protein YjbI with pentapeptide repeats
MDDYDGSQNVRDEELPVERKEPNRKQSEETKQSRWGFRGMTVRGWLELLIVPLVLVGIGLLFEMQQADRQEALENQQQALEQRRAEAERELAEQRAQDEALQAYLSQMSSLLLEKDLRASEEKTEVRTLARARTLSVLSGLDPSHKTDVMQFLVEAELVQRVEGTGPIISLGGADLSGADLSGAWLSDGANLSGANLYDADLHDANLSSANLSGADLRDADLRDADLSDTNLRDANLGYARLRGAKLQDADLEGATGVTIGLLEQELQAASLEGATMPDGSIHP